ncbi:MAG: RtcB family protein [Candidatus Muiribacteriota bacterium]
MIKIQKKNWKVPVYLFAAGGNYDNGVVSELDTLAESNIPYKHIALMPDYHPGYSVPIGTVFASENFVFPNAVGVDIGCGVKVIKLNLTVDDISSSSLKKIINDISKNIPTHANWRKEPLKSSFFEKKLPAQILKTEFENIKKQLGTLGGGNHFIELQIDNKKNVYIMIHCGSRNIGKNAADFYNCLAVEYAKKENLSIPVLKFKSPEGREYLRTMDWCLEFAAENRKQIGKIIFNIISSYFSESKIIFEHDIHHNYASFENHFNKKVLVHRKGAVRAGKGDIVLIPGCMGKSSYILEGMGNEISFNSASHGAGRVLSRKKARKKFKGSEIIKEFNSRSVLIKTSSIKSLGEEYAGAYKDIEGVLSHQQELVKKRIKLNSIGIIK